jgi:diaminopimelate epimerase
MLIEFYKYQGTGNDFIIIDNRSSVFSPYQANKKIISDLCNRKFGIGADGLILLNKSKDYDFEMIYFNSDGTGNVMCGNGGRCIVAFASYLKITRLGHTKFIAFDGEHNAKIIKDNRNVTNVSLKMQNVDNIEIIDDSDFFINTGAPHYIRFVENIKDLDVYNKARDIRFNNRFVKTGTNVDFVEIQKNYLFVRTYERGIEKETLSCGTGATASAIAASLKMNLDNNLSFNIKMFGGNLNISFKRNKNIFSDIWLKADVSKVFKGEIELYECSG